MASSRWKRIVNVYVVEIVVSRLVHWVLRDPNPC